MDERFMRSEAILGSGSLEKLKKSKVIVFGVGGVGGYTVEALARTGVGELHLVDPDAVALSNINRQIIALSNTVGRKKTEVMRERILSINPEARVKTFDIFYEPQNADLIDISSYDYIVDAIDTVKAKVEIITRAHKLGVPVISSMGFGNKLDPTRVEVADISKTSVCPLARTMRRLLREKGITHLKTVYSREEPQKISAPLDDGGKKSVGSLAYVPSVAGLVIASEVIKDLCR
ncbi:MAG: ThiF family adenylyltransferase [Ruminococcus sp.]